MAGFTESIVEEAALGWLRDVGYSVAFGPDLAVGQLGAERTDPGWIMLFPAAAGLVVERGSLLSHSAIVARELGLPAVVGVPSCTTWIVDGEVIELDGTTGIVRKVQP